MVNFFTNKYNNIEEWWKQNKMLLRKNIVETMRNSRPNDMEVLQIMVYLLDNIKIKENTKCVENRGLILMRKN